MTATRTARRTATPPAADITVPPAVPPVCDVCARYASIAGNVTRDGHVYVNRATVPECNADVARDRIANDTARAARNVATSDHDRAAANVAVKRTGDRVWRTRNPHGLGGTVTATRATRTAPTVTAPPAYYAACVATANRFTAAGMATTPEHVAAEIAAHVDAFIAGINVDAVYMDAFNAKIAATLDAIATLTNATA